MMDGERGERARESERERERECVCVCVWKMYVYVDEYERVNNKIASGFLSRWLLDNAFENHQWPIDTRLDEARKFLETLDMRENATLLGYSLSQITTPAELS